MNIGWRFLIYKKERNKILLYFLFPVFDQALKEKKGKEKKKGKN